MSLKSEVWSSTYLIMVMEQQTVRWGVELSNTNLIPSKIQPPSASAAIAPCKLCKINNALLEQKGHCSQM